MSRLLHRPGSVDEALALLAERPEARLLAGGATLVAMRNAGLVDASAYVALDGIAELRGIEQLPDGGLRIGAMTRHRETATCGLLRDSLEVVRRAASMIANPVVRNMGTMGGSVANADPGADYPAALVCVDVELELAGTEGRRRVPAAAFVQDWYETALEPGEILTAIFLPPPRTGRSTYRKLARVSGDYAIASCAMALTGGQGDEEIAVAIGGCGPGPLRDVGAEAALRGRLDAPGALAALGEALVALADPIDDVRASADYRLRVIPRLVRATLDDLRSERRAA